MYRGFIEKNGEVSYMKVKEKLKAYIVRLIQEESEELVKRQDFLEKNVRDLNAQMEGQEAIAENVRNLNAQMESQEAIAENVRNLNVHMEVVTENVRNLNVQIEAIAENVQNLNAQIEVQEAITENVRNLNAQMEWQESLAENVRNLNAQMENQEKKQEALEENIRSLNTIFQDHNKVTDNLQNNNFVIEKISSTLEMLKVKFAMFEKVNELQHNNSIVFDDSDGKANEKLISKEDTYSGIDYFDFENYFRGSIEQIKRNQQQYLKYYEGKSNVIDLGCGRGEFLTLLSENGIKSKGVDLYEEFVQMCTMNGLDVVCDDALRFLHTQRKVGGIFAGQLIEHLTINQLVELCNIAYEKLEEDAYIIMETPNPTCLAIYSHAFYIDPSHNKPVHPLTIKYILEKSGFKNIEIIYTDTSKLPVSIPEISGIEEADKFNEVMHMISELLFGSQDYAVIAKKC